MFNEDSNKIYEITRPIGFLPSYLPNSSVEINATANETTPSYGFKSVIDSSKTSKNDAFGITIPTSGDVNDSKRLTVSEEKDIFDELTKMKKLATTEEEDTVFFATEKRILELVQAALPRLQKAKKDNILVTIDDCKKKRQDWKQRKKAQKYAPENGREPLLDLALWMKIAELVLGVISFCACTRLFFSIINTFHLYLFSTMSITAIFAFYYACSKKSNLVALVLDILGCLSFGFFFVLNDLPWRQTLVKFALNTTGVLYFFDALGKLYLIYTK